MRPWLSSALGAFVALTAGPAQAEPTAAVFDFQLANLAQLPPTAADKARLPALSDLLRKEIADTGKYKIIPLTPAVEKEVADSAQLRSCGGCAATFAKELGAQVAITAQIQKVSDLILDMTVFVKEVDGSRPEQAYSVSIRGDQDTSFDHGVKFLVNEEMFKKR